MVAALIKRFIRNYSDTSSPEVRQQYGVLCGAVGIGLNILLFAGKCITGIISGSIAITADAFNNLSDAGSSLITIIGFRLSGHKPDPDHPYGHGRLEYVTGLIVSIIIILMGFELGKSSVAKILHPSPVQFSLTAVAVLTVSICVKLYMAAYNRRYARLLGSPAMEATMTDSLSDSVATAVVLAATIVADFTDIAIDGWCGLAVAAFILFAGYKAAHDTISPLLGQPPTRELVQQIDDIVMSHKEIIGIHDLIVHDYGPGRLMLSLHAEVPSDGDLNALHDAVDNAENELKQQLGCIATIHMDPIVCGDAISDEKKAEVTALVQAIDPRITLHDFRMVAGPTHINLIFDVVTPFDCAVADADIRERIRAGVSAMPDNCFAVVTIDKPYLRR